MNSLKVGSIVKNRFIEAPFRVIEHKPTYYSPDSYILKNLLTGWTFLAQNIILYEDGTCEWDFSVGGRFEDE